jgi:DNA adenine methylase
VAQVPQPIPYQGSKRALAARILDHLPERIGVLHEPFAGSAALSLAALARDRVAAVRLNDLNAPLVDLWRAVVADPDALADAYAAMWDGQRADPAAFYLRVRAAFNADPLPHRLLYLLARCVKAAVRYNAAGAFNQSADHRRLGRRPAAMRADLRRARDLLAGRVGLTAGDFRSALAEVAPDDVVYLDPPYAGVSSGADARYVAGLPAADLVTALRGLVERDVAFALSYDGTSGGRAYGVALPADLDLARVDLVAGRSATATLHRRVAVTVESLYLSPALTRRLRRVG